MLKEKKEELMEVFLPLDNGEYYHFDLTLPLQMLFDDVVNAMSKTD